MGRGSPGRGWTSVLAPSAGSASRVARRSAEAAAYWQMGVTVKQHARRLCTCSETEKNIDYKTSMITD